MLRRLNHFVRAPHAELFWRFSSQAGVLSGKWKLVFLAPARWLLFNTTSPEGETRELSAQHPDMVARLQRSLRTWCAEQNPVGLPTELHAENAYFFTRHLGLGSGPKS